MPVPSSGEVKGVDNQERGCTGSTACGQVASEKLPELLVFVQAFHEHFLIGVLEGEVERLRWEVPDHVNNIASPEG